MHLLASRGRPEALDAFFRESKPRERGVLILDADDCGNYSDVRLPGNWSVMSMPRGGLVRSLNSAFTVYPDEPWYSLLGDDIRGRPPSWDSALAVLAGTRNIVTGDDLINGARACCIPFIGGDLVRQVGWFAYPKLGHLYVDTIWGDIGRELGNWTYRPEFITEHLHWSTGKMAKDRTAEERRTHGDKAAYEAFRREEFAPLLARLRAC